MRHPVRSQDVNAYIREASGGPFSSRQFRTWGATCMAAVELARAGDPATKRELAQLTNAAVDRVAAKLVNTRSVCRSSYIHPLVFEHHEAGLLKNIHKLRLPIKPEFHEWMDEDEIRVMHWLRRTLREQENS